MRKILAIDDQLDNLTTVKAVIKMLMPNIEVLTAQSGEQGILLAKEKNPDVILLDIIMPKMDGYEVCRILKSDKKTSRIPVAMMTALKTDSASKVKALDLGAEVFIAKPIEPVELRAQLKVLLRTKDAEDKLREERDSLNETVKLRTKELAENEYKYRSLVESSQESILVLQDGIVQYANPVSLLLSGYKKEELFGSSFIEYIHKDDQELVLKNYKNRLEDINVASQPDFRLVCKSGEILWFNLIANKVEWKGEMAFLYVLHNRTEKLLQQQKIKESEAKYRSFAEHFNGIAFKFRNDFSVEFMSGKVTEILGYSEEAFIAGGINYSNLIHPHDKNAVTKSFSDFMDSNKNTLQQKYRIVDSEKNIKWILESTTKYTEKDSNGVYGTLQDISDEVNSQEQIQFQSTILQNLAEGVVLVGVESNKIIYVNSSLIKMFGYKGDELVGKDVRILNAPSKNNLAEKDIDYITILAKSGSWSGDIKNITKIGREFWSHTKINKYQHPVYGEVWISIYEDITERKEIESQISLQNQYLETIHLNAPINFWIFEIKDGKYYFAYQNEQASQKTRISDNELIGKELSELAPVTISTEGITALKEKFDEVVRTKKRVETKGPIEIKGEMLWFVAVYSPLFNEEGEIYRIISSSVSIDEQVEKEKELLESEVKFRSFVEQFQGIAFRKINNQTLDLIEGNVEEITGYKINDFKSGNVTFDMIIHPDDYEKVKAKDKVFIESDLKKMNSEFRIINANDSIHWISEISTKHTINQQTWIYGTLQDISQLKEAIIMLEESNAFNQTLIDTLPFPLQIVDEMGTILFMNPIFENLVGTEKLGRKCWEAYRDDKEQCENCPLFKNLPIGQINKTEYSGVFDDRTFEIIFRNMLFDGKKALMEIFIDTTERKQYEEHLVIAKNQALESDRLKSAFLANMSHEIRTPMNGILGFLDLLEDVNLTQNEREHFIGIIKTSGDRLLSTINDIIELSKIEAGEIPLKLTDNNLGESIRYLTEFFSVEAESKGIKLHSEISDYYIRTDFNKLDSVLTNLIKNAVKFTDTGSISFGYEALADKLQFYVKDTGNGIAPDQIEIIFNRFTQADNSFSRGYEGSGLGLSISMAYVKMLGGEIWVESEIGKGSTFYFTIDFIPVENTISESQILKQYKLHDDIPKAQILIAEDDELSYLLIQSLLVDSGYNLIRATNGNEAITKLKENPFIAMILMDLKMPEMDGITATRLIRQFDTELPIIAQTAFALLGDREKALEVGCNDYISKPIKKYQLLQLIKKHLK